MYDHFLLHPHLVLKGFVSSGVNRAISKLWQLLMRIPLVKSMTHSPGDETTAKQSFQIWN